MAVLIMSFCEHRSTSTDLLLELLLVSPFCVLSSDRFGRAGFISTRMFMSASFHDLDCTRFSFASLVLALAVFPELIFLICYAYFQRRLYLFLLSLLLLRALLRSFSRVVFDGEHSFKKDNKVINVDVF